MSYDAINPQHYRAANGMESIDVIEAFVPDKPHRWAALKYLFRAGKKPEQDEVQDLRKAIWWIEREIGKIEQAEKAPERSIPRFTVGPAPAECGPQPCLCDGACMLESGGYLPSLRHCKVQAAFTGTARR